MQERILMCSAPLIAHSRFLINVSSDLLDNTTSMNVTMDN